MSWNTAPRQAAECRDNTVWCEYMFPASREPISSAQPMALALPMGAVLIMP